MQVTSNDKLNMLDLLEKGLKLKLDAIVAQNKTKTDNLITKILKQTNGLDVLIKIVVNN